MAWQNPVLQRELIESLRHPRSFLVLGLFVAMLSGVVLLAWPDHVGLARRDVISQTIYDTFALGQMALLALMAPIFSAPAIAGERERHSLDLLLASPLTPGAIVRGKLMGAVVYLGLLAFSSLPIFSLTYLLGAAGPREVGATYLVLLTVAVLSGAIGLAASTWLGRTRAALSVSYVAVIPCVMFFLWFRGAMRNLPLAILLAGAGLSVAAILTAAVVRRLREPFDPAPKGYDDDPAGDLARSDSAADGLLDRYLTPPRAGRAMPDGAGAMYEKELRFDGFGMGSRLLHTLAKAGLLSSIPFLVGTVVMLASQERGHWVFLWYLLAFVMLVGPSLAAGAFTQERERGTLDLLVTSGLSRDAILSGKIRAPLRNVLLLAGLQLPLYLLVILPWAMHRGVIGLVTPLVGIAMVAATAVFTVRLAVFFSLINSTTLRSMVTTYMAVGALFVATFVAYLVLTQLGDWPDDGAGAFLVGFASPFHALARMEDLTYAPAVGGLQIMAPILYLALTTIGGMALWGLTWSYYPRYAQCHHDRKR